jgi:hypothetical protein
MAVALSIFGVAFAALCVWLTVRIINRRERWAKWTALGLVVAATVVGAYAPAYTRMVRPSLSDEVGDATLSIFGSWKIELVPDYQGYDPGTGYFAGRDQSFWEKVFAPAHWVDRHIRRDVWVIEHLDPAFDAMFSTKVVPAE